MVYLIKTLHNVFWWFSLFKKNIQHSSWTDVRIVVWCVLLYYGNSAAVEFIYIYHLADKVILKLCEIVKAILQSVFCGMPLKD